MYGFTPTQTGGDTAEFIVPFHPLDGTTRVTWNVGRIEFRVGTGTTSSTSTINVQRSGIGTGAFSSAGNLLTTDLSITGSNNWENWATTGFATSTVQSGEKVRVNVVALGAGHSYWDVNLTLNSYY